MHVCIVCLDVFMHTFCVCYVVWYVYECVMFVHTCVMYVYLMCLCVCGLQLLTSWPVAPEIHFKKDCSGENTLDSVLLPEKEE